MTVDTWAAVVGFVLPVVVAVINRENWKPWLKAVVALVASVAGGTVTALLSGQFTGGSWLQSIGIVFAASQLFYHTWWKNSNITGWIEQAINIFSGQPKAITEPALGGTPGMSRDAGTTG